MRCCTAFRPRRTMPSCTPTASSASARVFVCRREMRLSSPAARRTGAHCLALATRCLMTAHWTGSLTALDRISFGCSGASTTRALWKAVRRSSKGGEISAQAYSPQAQAHPTLARSVRSLTRRPSNCSRRAGATVSSIKRSVIFAIFAPPSGKRRSPPKRGRAKTVRCRMPTRRRDSSQHACRNSPERSLALSD